MDDGEAKERYERAIQLFDAANSLDPNREPVAGGNEARELIYARRLTDWVLRLNPGASEVLRLAARCQHLCRWEIARSAYPSDRAGYLRWRRDLQQFHAQRSGEILRQVGYADDVIARVRSLNLKQNLGKDPELQVLEDALCLVFLEFQLRELASRTEPEKVVNALRKSWAKMSEEGRVAALKLEYGEGEREMLRKALEVSDVGPGKNVETR